MATCLGKQFHATADRLSEKRMFISVSSAGRYVEHSFDHEKIWWMWLRRIGSGPLRLW